MKVFSKLFVSSCLGLLSLGFTFSALAREDDDLQKLIDSCTSAGNLFTIVVMEDNPPFSWVTYTEGSANKGVNAYGIGPLIMDELLKDAKVERFRYLKEERRADIENLALGEGETDATIGIQYTPKLDPQIQRDFIKPSFMANPIVAVMPKGKEKKIDGVKDLYGLKGGMLVRDDLQKVFPSDLALAKLKSTKEAFLRLRNGELDYVLMGYYTAKMDAKKFQVEDEVTISEKILRSTNLFITLSQKSTCRILRDTFNKKLKEITADKNKMGGLLYRVYEEYEKQNQGFPALQ